MTFGTIMSALIHYHHPMLFVCQLCNNLGHAAIDCLHHFDTSNTIHASPSFSVSDWLYHEYNEALGDYYESMDKTVPFPPVSASDWCLGIRLVLSRTS